MDENKTDWQWWVKFIVGTCLFVWLIYVHAWVKELSVFILAMPGLIMGLDLSKVIQIGGGKK